MRFWWVNQNQTFRHEIGGGYLWSPKRNANWTRNPFYEHMRELAPGDLVFSFVDTRIFAISSLTHRLSVVVETVDARQAPINCTEILDVRETTLAAPKRLKPPGWPIPKQERNYLVEA